LALNGAEIMVDTVLIGSGVAGGAGTMILAKVVFDWLKNGRGQNGDAKFITTEVCQLKHKSLVRDLKRMADTQEAQGEALDKIAVNVGVLLDRTTGGN